MLLLSYMLTAQLALDHSVLQRVNVNYHREGERSVPSNSNNDSRRILAIYKNLLVHRVRQDHSILFDVLKACSSLRDLYTGIKVHADLLVYGHDGKIVVANALIHMYFKCRSKLHAYRVFNTMPHQNVVSWNTMMFGYLESGEGEVAFQLFIQMQDAAVTPDALSFVAALKASANCAAKQKSNQVEWVVGKINCLEKTISIHSQLTKTRKELDIALASTLVDTYAKCGGMVHARRVFDKMLHHSVVTWTVMIFGYVESGEAELALHFFRQMQEEAVSLDALTYIAAMKACASCAEREAGEQVDGKLVKVGCLRMGQAIHTQLVEGGHQFDISVGNTLVDVYAKCGSMVDASHVFGSMLHLSVITWNAFIFGHAQIGENALALELFACMQVKGFMPDGLTYAAALKACTNCAKRGENAVQVEGLSRGIAIHSKLVRGGQNLDMVVANTLMDMYTKFGIIHVAHEIFDSMLFHDVVSWNALIFAYAEAGQGKLALQLFARMQDEGFRPDALTYVAVLKGCASKGSKSEEERFEHLAKATIVHSQLAKNGHELDLYVASTLIDMYAKCGSIVHAYHVFNRMQHHSMVTWTALIFGCAEGGEGNLALQLFARMQDKGFIPNSQTYIAALKACASRGELVNGKVMAAKYLEMGITIHSQLAKSRYELDIFLGSTLVDMYAKCGSMVHAQQVFDRMSHHDIVSWNAMIFGYVECGEGNIALQLFAHMQHEGFLPVSLSYVAALKACSCLGALETGRQIHNEICTAGFQSDVAIASCLVGFYGRCGSMVDAHQVFDSMSRKDTATWNSLLLGYAHQGDAKQVFGMFKEMQEGNFQADDKTFVSIFTACTHAGLVEKGRESFHAMCSEHMVIPSAEHYACLVDLLGRANHLDDAMVVVRNMSSAPDLAIWKIVLGACHKWKNIAVGNTAFECMLRSGEKDASTFVLMANIYAGSGV